jgi:hypothetical protein
MFILDGVGESNEADQPISLSHPPGAASREDEAEQHSDNISDIAADPPQTSRCTAVLIPPEYSPIAEMVGRVF